ncbi:MAG: valyl-tRNA synthetase [Solirubrobacteraceae bacterium]|jgi:valyl-tRNA synthetase|nr:valyl-tRNA synthetase [Solirubrobacteraceae bacterium]
MSEPFESRTRYDPAEAEPRILAAWLESGLFHPEPAGTPAENYSIAIPPPNVTGVLHMGHALNGSIQDTLIRYHRMLGRRTKWILGTDHAGIATQTQVERQLVAEGSGREELGRAAFVERVWDWRSRYGGAIVEQYKRLGASCDYQTERFTLDDDYAAAVTKVFIALFEKGLIYRDNYLVNWDPGTRSAISDLEVAEQEVTDTLYLIAYPLAEGDGDGDGDADGEVVVATVRPETMLADTAVAVNPADPRYQHLIGREVILPLLGRRLRIIADDYVKVDFGSGALKITPGHDPNDFEIGRRHGLEQISVIGEDGRMTEAAGPRFAGLPVASAQAAVIAALEEDGVLRGREPLTHAVPFSHRSGRRIEPLISLQWFMRMGPLAAPAIAAVEAGRVRFHPESQGRRCLDWMESIRPWCISRQLWWGHRLPVYYCDACEETYVAAVPPARCGLCDGEVRQDDDVLDTWFSSALWPFVTLGWPEPTAELAAFYPTDVLTTARDIVFLWVARMIMMGLEFTGEAPFHDVYVHSVILAPDKRRMSKSLGNGVDPIAEIDRHGADAVRFGLLAMSSTQDVPYSAEKIAQGQALANKLFNASRFVLLRVAPDAVPAPVAAAIEDRWILSRLTRIELELARRIEAYDFSHAAHAVYDFVYRELCDWYLELVKGRLAGEGDGDGDGDGEDRLAVSQTLLHVLRETLALAHPLIPFVTEEVWTHVRRPGDGLLAGAAFPVADEALLDPRAEAGLERAIAATEAIRGWRDEVAIKPKVIVPVRLAADGYDEVAPLVARMARLRLETAGAGGPRAGGGARARAGAGAHGGVGVDGGVGGDVLVRVPVPGGIVEVLAGEGVDLRAHGERRAKRREELEAEIARAAGKLANPGFVAKAPAEVVAAQHERLAQLEAELTAL